MKSKLRTFWVSHVAGSLVLAALLSSTAIGQTNCISPPTNIVSWWRAEENALDRISTNNGTFIGQTTYGAGKVGQAFVFDGSGDGMDLGNPPGLQLQDFTIEGWIKRSSASSVSLTANEAGLVSYGGGGYGFTIFYNGDLSLARVGDTSVGVTAGVTGTGWHHVGVTKSGGTVIFYVDGTAIPASTFNPTFSFSTSVDIGSGNGGSYSFFGAIDELAIYSRALAGSEIQSIYNAGTNGKCGSLIPPTIVSQPANQSTYVGMGATFSVTASGDALRYQWFFNDTNVLSGATNSQLVLSNVQFTNAGNYSVVISNIIGSVTSSNALLTVNPAPPCVAPPSGIVSWWRAEGNALDSTGTNNGTFVGNTTSAAGKVGLAFSFDGNGDGIDLGNPANLRLQNFTIEGWIKRSSASVVSQTDGEAGLVSYGGSGYGFTIFNNGSLSLAKVGTGGVGVSTSVTNTSWHHVAVTKSGTAVVFYVDGVAIPAASFNNSFSFSTPVDIGSGNGGGYCFLGAIDELAIYNRALAAGEVQSIYIAGAAGKCSSSGAPVIISQPTNQTTIVGVGTAFAVTAFGEVPLKYQWLFNDTNVLSGATNSQFVLTTAQFSDAGNYSVVVSNAVGSVTSSNALLTVNSAPPCVTPPAGLISWWRAEGDAVDHNGIINGNFFGNASITSGRIGLAFAFDGSGDGIDLGNPAELMLQDFTCEAWIKRSSASIISVTGTEAGLLSYGNGGYGFTIFSDGSLSLAKVGSVGVGVAAGITNTSWHHVAVTKSGTNVVFYVDGTAIPATPFATTFTFTSPVDIGSGNSGSFSFLGAIDELAIYNRALATNEIQAIYGASVSGKCTGPIAPVVTANPTSRTVVVGTSTTFNVSSLGTHPVSYQWMFNDTNVLGGATSASLTITNVQFTNAGNYSVVITNGGGSVTSSNARLTVVFPPAVLRLVGNTNAVPGSTTVVPVQLVANGNENALGLSISYNNALLAFKSVTQGSGATNASLFFNTNQIPSGRVGFLLGLGSGQTFTNGTQEIMLVSFDVIAAPASSNRTTTLSFGDAPTPRQLSDTAAVPLSVFYSNANLTIPAVDWEGDAAPRPNGDKQFFANDWVQVGRFVAGLDTPNNGSEYQRADCAPRSTLGNGVLSITDWVQAGRYAAGLDPLTPVGGPTEDTPGPIAPPGGAKSLRTVRVTSKTVQASTTDTVSVELDATGNENALGFTLSFNPALVQFVSSSPGSGAAGVTFNINTSQVGTGKLGVGAALGANLTFTPGTKEILKLDFAVAPTAAGTSNVLFVNSPVRMEVSDPDANSLAATYTPGTFSISPFPPVLRISANTTNVLVAWPVVASNYVLQVNDTISGNWSNAPAPAVIGPDNVVTTPIGAGTKFYRLFKP